MERLVTDRFTRRIAQAILLGIVLYLCVAAAAFLLITFAQAIGYLSGGMAEFARNVLAFLSLPITETNSQLATAIVAALPVVFSVVCFKVDTTAIPLKPDKRLNRTGKISTIILLIGLVLSILSVIILTRWAPLVSSIVLEDSGDSTNTPMLLKGVFGGLVSFQLVYLTQLMGLVQK